MTARYFAMSVTLPVFGVWDQVIFDSETKDIDGAPMPVCMCPDAFSGLILRALNQEAELIASVITQPGDLD